MDAVFLAGAAGFWGLMVLLVAGLEKLAGKAGGRP